MEMIIQEYMADEDEEEKMENEDFHDTQYETAEDQRRREREEYARGYNKNVEEEEERMVRMEKEEEADSVVS